MYSIFLVNIILGEIALILFLYIWEYISKSQFQVNILKKWINEFFEVPQIPITALLSNKTDQLVTEHKDNDSGVIPYKTNKQAKEEKEKQKGPELEDLLP